VKALALTKVRKNKREEEPETENLLLPLLMTKVSVATQEATLEARKVAVVRLLLESHLLLLGKD